MVEYCQPYMTKNGGDTAIREGMSRVFVSGRHIKKKELIIMNIPFENLTEDDFAILVYIKKHSPISIGAVIKHFGKRIDAVDNRVFALLNPEHSIIDNRHVLTVPNSSYIQKVGSDKNPDLLELTVPGKHAVQNYLTSKRVDRQKFLFRSVAVPIMVTVATELILHGILWLLPLIKELVTRIQ